MEEQTPITSFRAPRPPAVWSVSGIADALRSDIAYDIPYLFKDGAGDTYFSGKTIARLSRILVVHKEMEELCEVSVDSVEKYPELDEAGAMAYPEVCGAIGLPTNEEFQTALESLRATVQLWLDGTGATPFLYDELCEYWMPSPFVLFMGV